jgi:hypothetical protein
VIVSQTCTLRLNTECVSANAGPLSEFTYPLSFGLSVNILVALQAHGLHGRYVVRAGLALYGQDIAGGRDKDGGRN